MRTRTTRTASLLSVIAVVALTGCPEDPPAKTSGTSGGATTAPAGSGSSGKSSSGGGGGGGAFSCKGKPEVGKPASSFSLTSLNGGKVAIEPGKVTLVDFWATWCGPCEKSFPKYQEFYVKYKASGLEIAAVSVDSDEKKGEIPNFVKKTGAKFPVGWDEGHKIADCYNPPGMPAAFLIDKKGVVRFIHEGYRGEADAKEMEEKIKGLL